MKNAPETGAIPGQGGSHFPLELLQAVFADQLILVSHNIPRIVAENAGRMVLFENDLVVLHKDFQCIAQADIHGPAQFNGNYDSAQIVQFADYPRRFQCYPLPNDNSSLD